MTCPSIASCSGASVIARACSHPAASSCPRSSPSLSQSLSSKLSESFALCLRSVQRHQNSDPDLCLYSPGRSRLRRESHEISPPPAPTYHDPSRSGSAHFHAESQAALRAHRSSFTARSGPLLNANFHSSSDWHGSSPARDGVGRDQLSSSRTMHGTVLEFADPPDPTPHSFDIYKPRPWGEAALDIRAVSTPLARPWMGIRHGHAGHSGTPGLFDASSAPSHVSVCLCVALSPELEGPQA